MRRSYLLLVLLAWAAAGNAQKGTYYSGLKLGSSFYTLENNTTYPGLDKKMKPSVIVGIFYNIPIAKGFHLQPELVYSGEGVKYKDSVHTLTTRLHYVAIPLMLQYELMNSGIYLEAGPQFAVLIQGRQFNSKVSTTEGTDLSKTYKATNFALGAGVGYHKGLFGVNFRYNTGLSNISKLSTDPVTKSNGFQIGANLWFSQGAK